MKKHLLTSTALVAAGMMAVSAPAIAGSKSLVLKGDTRQLIGIGENDEAFDAANGQRVGFDQQTDGEIHFVGSVTLDNGIKIKTNVRSSKLTLRRLTPGTMTSTNTGCVFPVPSVKSAWARWTTLLWR